MPRLPKRPPLKIEDFHYLLDSSFPQLVLGVHYPHESFRSEYPAANYRFKATREWKKIAHQTAGHGCHQHYFIGTVVKPKDSVRIGMEQLAAKWLGRDAGVGGVSLDELNEYRADLQRLFGAGVDCNQSYRLFEEGIYPVDTENLAQLADEKFPEDLDDLIKWESGFERCCGCIGRFSLCILGENGD